MRVSGLGNGTHTRADVRTCKTDGETKRQRVRCFAE